jgi:hypothetical protein
VPLFVGLGGHGEVRHALLDMAAVIRDLASRPTHVNELVQKELNYIGYCDASAFGAGGVWFGGTQRLCPIVWRIQWLEDITNSVVSESNPAGQIRNSDLEMAGILLHKAVLKTRHWQSNGRRGRWPMAMTTPPLLRGPPAWPSKVNPQSPSAYFEALPCNSSRHGQPCLQSSMWQVSKTHWRVLLQALLQEWHPISIC